MEIRNATKVAKVVLPRNWEYVTGYRGAAPSVAFHWSQRDNAVYWFDGHHSGFGKAIQLYQALLSEYRMEIMGALHALNVRSPYPLGNEIHKATHCLVVEIQGRSVRVARINDAKQFMKQFPITNLLVFPRPRQGVLTRPCTCFYGWKFENDEYCLCDVCHGSEVVRVEERM